MLLNFSCFKTLGDNIMASVTNAKTYNAVNSMREDLSNIIDDISPTSTPFMSNIGRDTADNTYFEWQTDALAAADGANAAVQSVHPLVTLTSLPQTVLQTTRRSAPRSSRCLALLSLLTWLACALSWPMSRQRRQKKSERDMEKILCSNQAANAGSASAARYTAGLPAWLITNSIANSAVKPTLSSSPNGYPNAAWTSLSTATDVAFTETMLEDCHSERSGLKAVNLLC